MRNLSDLMVVKLKLHRKVRKQLGNTIFLSYQMVRKFCPVRKTGKGLNEELRYKTFHITNKYIKRYFGYIVKEVPLVVQKLEDILKK